MKILNEKGKLFGIINIVDLLIIVFLVVGAGVVYKYFNNIIQLNGGYYESKYYLFMYRFIIYWVYHACE